MAHSTPPALNADHRIALTQDTEFDGVHDTPLQAAVNIFLPGLCAEVWLLFREDKGVNASVKVCVL